MRADPPPHPTQAGLFYKLKAASGDRFENEVRFFERVGEASSSSPPDPIAGHTPRYFGVVEREGQQYLKMGSVTEGFERPHLLDIKMGVRCYTEEETTKTKLRKDLYERLITMGESHHLTDLEKEQKAITKSRWMELRDAMSSTTTLGFRIDAVLTPSGHKTAFKSNLFRVHDPSEVVVELRAFLPTLAACAAAGNGAHPRAIAARFVELLGALDADLRASAVFGAHEFIGSTLFFVADANGGAGVWMIDFGITRVGPEGGLQHDVPWVLGNREDGYMIGLARLTAAWKSLCDDDEWL